MINTPQVILYGAALLGAHFSQPVLADEAADGLDPADYHLDKLDNVVAMIANGRELDTYERDQAILTALDSPYRVELPEA